MSKPSQRDDNKRMKNISSPPSFQEPSFEEIFQPTANIDPVKAESIRKAMLKRTDWYNPFFIDDKLVSLRRAWMKDFHYYRHQHIFQNILTNIGSLEGLSVLDIGCNEGYYSFAASRMGASEVTGIDLRQENISCAKQLKQLFGYDGCNFQIGNIVDMEISDLMQFDIVFCFGVLYHLENPMIGVRNLRKLTRSWLVLDSCLTSFDSEPTVLITEEPNTNLRAGKTGVAFYPSLGGLLKMLKCGGFNAKVLPATAPPFWSPYCNHDYRRNQVSLICR